MNGETPWRLKVHFDHYPDYILPLQDIEQYWLNQIKESCYIHNGNAKSIMTLSKQDTSSLWESVLNHDQSRWKCIYGKLKLEYKRIPLRVYLNDTKLDKVVQFHGQTLADTMHELLPELFPGTSSVITHGVEAPMDSPILELFQECVYIDGFLQLCVIIEAH
jgi:autophagy-related protein 5